MIWAALCRDCAASSTRSEAGERRARPWRTALKFLLGGALLCLAMGVLGYARFLTTAAQTTASPRFDNPVFIQVAPNVDTLYKLRQTVLFDYLFAVGRGAGPWNGPIHAPPSWTGELAMPAPVDGAVRTSVTGGLPWRCFVGTIETNTQTSAGEFVRRGVASRYAPWTLWTGNEVSHAIPTHVLVGPFLANCVFWSASLLVAMRLPAAIRVACVQYRRRHQRCVACNYDLRGVDHGVCPECGNPVAPAHGSHEGAAVSGSLARDSDAARRSRNA